MNTTKIDNAVQELKTMKHKTMCLHWGIRAGKSFAIHSFLSTSTFRVERVLIVSHNPDTAFIDYQDALNADFDTVRNLDGIKEGVYDLIIFEEIEWQVKSKEAGIALYEKAVELVSKDGYVLVAGTQNYGICDELSTRVDYYSKILTTDVHPDLEIGNDASSKRDYLLEIVDEKF